MADDISIVIGAQDKASKVINDVVKNADTKLKQFKTVAASGKASAELTGTLAKTLGGTALGAFSGELAGITERISAFSEVSQQGAGGALAFKAGLAGVAAVAGFKIGTMIGDWVLETEKFTKQLQDANVELLKAADISAGLTATRLSIATQKIELIDDPAKQDAAYRARIAALTNEAGIHSQNIKLAKEQWEIEDRTISGRARMLQDAQQIAEWRAAEIADDQKKLDVIEKERAAILGKFNVEARELETLKEQAALKKQAGDYIESLNKELEILRATNDEQKIKIEASQKSGGSTMAAAAIESLLKEKQAIIERNIAQKEGDDQKKRDAEKQKDDAKKLVDLKASELANLEKQRILLSQGEEAAHAFALAQKGLDDATAKRIASEQAAIDEATEAREGAKGFTPGTQAVESRLLTRGPAEKGIDKIALNTAEMVKEQVKTREALKLIPSASAAAQTVLVG